MNDLRGFMPVQTGRILCLFFGVLIGAPVPGLAQTHDDFIAIGRAIAVSLDSTNSVPVESRTGSDCSLYDICPNAGAPTREDDVS